MMLYQRRLLLELMGNTVITMVLLLAVLMLVASVQVVSSFEGLGIGDFLVSVPIFAATTLDILLPLAVLVAVVLTYGRAASDNEVDTLRAGGVGALYLLTPGAIFGLLMSIVMLWCLDYGLPHAMQAKRRMQDTVDLAQVIKKKLASGDTVELDDNTAMHVGWVDEEGLSHNVRIQVVDGQGVREELLAETADIGVDEAAGTLVLHLFDVRRVIGDRMEGNNITLVRHLGGGDVEVPFKAMTTPQLMAWSERDRGRRQRFGWTNVQMQIAGRAASSAACLLFVLLGLPVALAVRRADRVGAFGVAFVLSLFVYYPLVQVGRTLADSGTLSPALGAWTGNLVMAALSAVLWVRLARR